MAKNIIVNASRHRNDSVTKMFPGYDGILIEIYIPPEGGHWLAVKPMGEGRDQVLKKWKVPATFTMDAIMDPDGEFYRGIVDGK